MFNQSITCSTFNQMSFQIHFKNSEIKNTTLEILDTVRRVGAKGFLVGGCIRDALLDKHSSQRYRHRSLWFRAKKVGIYSQRKILTQLCGQKFWCIKNKKFTHRCFYPL